MTGTCRAVAAAVVLLGSSCAQVVTETRRERGPLLRTFEREAPKEPAGLRAEARVRWPSLELSLSSSSVCRTELVREYAEEVVTERSSPGAGPSIVTGVTATAVGTALLLLRGALSNAPNTQFIDPGGRYGPSDRQVATGWAIPLLVIGVPSIAVGVVQLTQAGESTSQQLVDQIAELRETPCDERPANGVLAVLGPEGPLDTRPTQDGKVALPPEALKGTVVGLSLDGAPVSLYPEDADVLAAFRACARMTPPDDDALAKTPVPELLLRLEEARRCATIPNAGGAEAATRLADALVTRTPPSYATMEQAVAALSPSLDLAVGSPDVAKLSGSQPLEGAAARVNGTFVRFAGPDLLVLAVGTLKRPQSLFIQMDREWPEPRPRQGQVVEVVGVFVGRRTVGELEAPLLRAAFVGPAAARR